MQKAKGLLARAVLAVRASTAALMGHAARFGAAGSLAAGVAVPVAAAPSANGETQRATEPTGFTQRLGAVSRDMASKGLTAEDVSPLKSTRHYAWWNWHQWGSTAVTGVRG
jgi:hypothetical protein